MLAFVVGLVLVLFLGLLHNGGLLALKRITPDPQHRPHLSIATLFGGLLALHVAEILLFALAYAVLLVVPGIGSLTGAYSGSWEDLVYFSGINFATLGYTQIQVEGPLRLISMLQSLGGFMIITWSATFIYTVWGDAWRKS